MICYIITCFIYIIVSIYIPLKVQQTNFRLRSTVRILDMMFRINMDKMKHILYVCANDRTCNQSRPKMDCDVDTLVFANL